MPPHLSRREFLGAGALGLAVAGLGGLTSCGRVDHPTTREAVGYGPLLEDPEGILALPSGFVYTVLARSGETSTSDGTHPSDPDGMGVFDGGRGGTVLICNHENDGSEPHAVPAVEELTYDPGASGGAPPPWSSTPRATGCRSTRPWPGRSTTAPAESRPGARG